jgi:hypothetical protein
MIENASENIPQEINDVQTGVVPGVDLYQEAAVRLYGKVASDLTLQQRQLGRYLLYAAATAGHEAVRLHLLTKNVAQSIVHVPPPVDNLDNSSRLRLFQTVINLTENSQAVLDPIYENSECDGIFRSSVLTMVTQLRSTLRP